MAIQTTDLVAKVLEQRDKELEKLDRTDEGELEKLKERRLEALSRNPWNKRSLLKPPAIGQKSKFMKFDKKTEEKVTIPMLTPVKIREYGRLLLFS